MPREGRGARRAALLVLPPLAFLAVLFLYPVGMLIAQSFTGAGAPFGNYQRLFVTPLYLQVLQRTLWLSAGTTLICALLGYPVAYRLAHGSPRGKAVLLVFILLPFWTNLLVRTYGWMVLLNPKGVINQALLWLGWTGAPLPLVYNSFGVLVGMVQIMIPYMILPIAAVMAQVDPQLRNAARSLGAGPGASFAFVYFPMTLPGVMAGVLLVFTVSLGFFVVPAVLGGPRDLVLAQLIEFNVNTSLNWGLAGALSTVLLAVTVAIFAASQRWLGMAALWGGAR
jgi:ABC-type spermidine/putrescine transport system permease subunit I